MKAYSHLKEEILDFNPDIITSHSSKAGFLGRIIAWRLNIPNIFTAHGWAFTDGKSKIKQTIYRLLEWLVVPITDKIIAVSDYDRNLGIQQLSLSEDKIITIHNGMTDIDKKLMSVQQSEGPVNIIMVARFDHQKDQQELLKATHNIENIHIHFVGDGHLRSKTEELANELNMREKITFWGELDSVDEVLAKSQIFALISNWEGFPCSTLEGMRAGLPTVVSDVGGSAEAIDEGVTGYAVKKGNVNVLHNVLEELVQNTEKRVAMGKLARERFESHYTFQTMYEKTLKTYFKVINNNKN
jgi:glycosyltransferase involved in cell wall biosynthesis